MKPHNFFYTIKKLAIVAIIIVSMLHLTVQQTSALTDDTSSESAMPEPANSETTSADTSTDTLENTQSDSTSDYLDDTSSSSENVKDKTEDTPTTSEQNPGNSEDSPGNSEENQGNSKDSPDNSEENTSNSEGNIDNSEDDTISSKDKTENLEDSANGSEDGNDSPENNTGNLEDNKNDSDVSNDCSDTNTDCSDNTSDESQSTLNNPDHGNTDKSAKISTSSRPNMSSQSEVSTSPNTNIKDRSAGAIYIRPYYDPSEPFIDLKNRIKYNTALPLDNIPSFITQEMIIGALKCQDETGFPASVTIAQIIQESGFGRYGSGGENRQGLSYLAYQYCNLFGIKGTGTAGTVNMLTGEQKSSGEYYSTTAGFRVYNTYTECIEDRTNLLKRVYGDLIKGVTDANTFAMRIGSRWATSIKYSQHLIQQMERYDLYRLDRMTLKDFSNMIGRFADPCPGSYLTSPFGYRNFDHKFHKGIDLGTNGANIPVYAAESGTIIKAGYDNLAGNWVMIDHGNELVTKYMHFSYTFVQEGDQVTKGQQIGLTGSTGRSTGVHLHFQVEENGVAVDPTPYLNTTEE